MRPRTPRRRAAITNTWSGVNTGTSGTVSIANAGCVGTLAAGQTTNFGFLGAGTGATVSCAGS